MKRELRNKIASLRKDLGYINEVAFELNAFITLNNNVNQSINNLKAQVGRGLVGDNTESLKGKIGVLNKDSYNMAKNTQGLITSLISKINDEIKRLENQIKEIERKEREEKARKEKEEREKKEKEKNNK